ncbi:Hypothetical Protein FCC1311_061232 [Hondaea fermentalgiana]|uniref:Uncharacterized protein n=1 Tax=Hondaea fermentalgiana TaxID=2315210 RepID=A0A2R5GMP4_9STRA|nr:Hypothetical Protein FCC1311_061232 [Hondaea fermentalgiana]|eukprot:GBG29903.1 Hypothetical Protein FCC1311_061232 [Hondaea fermentalgiana]
MGGRTLYAFSVYSGAEVAEHVNDLALETTELSKALNKLQHRIEHDLESTKLSLEKMMQKLEEKEDNSQDRIGDLEKARKEQISKHIDDRLAKLEATMHDTIEARLALLETKVGIQVEEAKSSSGGWRLPLVLIVLCVAAYMAYTARSLKKLSQRDKLF